MLQIILLLNPIFTTFLWALELNINSPKKYYSKVFLGKFMIIALIMFIGYLFYYYPFDYYYYYYFDSLLEFSILLLLPVYYIYVRLLTVDNKFSFRKHFKYFAPHIFLIIFYIIGNFSISPEDHYMLSYNKGIKISGNVLYFVIVEKIINVFYVIQSIYYVVISYSHIKKYKDRIQNYYANTDEDSLDKVYAVNLSISVASLIFIFISFMDKSFFLTSNYWSMIPCVMITCLFFTIGWIGNIQKSVVIDDSENYKIDTNDDSEDSYNTQFDFILKKIEHLFNEEKIYLNKNLTLWELSDLIGSNKTYISMVINNYYNQNFSSFVNTYRAKHAENLIQKNPQLTNSDLANLSGFGSVISMQRAFQSFEGKTIREIKKDLKN